MILRWPINLVQQFDGLRVIRLVRGQTEHEGTFSCQHDFVDRTRTVLVIIDLRINTQILVVVDPNELVSKQLFPVNLHVHTPEHVPHTDC